MSYFTISLNVNDGEFTSRLLAAIAQEGHDHPEDFVPDVRWPVCTAADIEAAYASALAAANPHPGSDPAVITDQMILSAVQPLLPPP